MSGHHTAAVHCGSPSPQFYKWESTKVFCHGFVGLSVECNVLMKSPEFTSCLGHSWALWIFPGGCSHAIDGYVSILLIGYVSILLVSRSNKKKNDVGYGLTLLEIEVVSIHNLRTVAPRYGELLALLVYLTRGI